MLKDEELNAIIVNNSGDIWKQIAAKENNVPYAEVTVEQRANAKNKYFSALYGGI